MPLQHPVGYVDDMDVLLDDDISAEHLVHVEIQDAALPRVHARLGLVRRGPAGVIKGLAENRLPDIAPVNTLDCLLVDGLGACLEIDQETDLALRFLTRLEKALAPPHVHRDG